ncbi:citrate/2-methylcitrate synthase [Amycolatopsis sp. CA-230715]|uniref:citrate/2-methylcitrate synthase n=1 Tax=Amycolatopsis sp. CA-230715 TaxID=2745196 RepID=UPI001C01B00B|nr:citrate/2-methylcitrate synthase [Amycolatopsis sp. CA-230715]QWF76933.1 Citrate synthase 2 [Amycolatopsis sp. CA-230715]
MATSSDERYLTTAEVARRLGVKAETVYTYVSRGLLTSVRAKGRRGSLFPLGEVDRLAERGSEGHQPSGSVERIRTRLTRIDGDELAYRGHRVRELVGAHGFEAVVSLLWTEELAARPPFPAPADEVALARAVGAALPKTASLTDRLRVAVAALGSADPLRFDVSAEAVTAAAGPLLGVLVDALPGETASGTLAERLWPKVSAHSPRPELLDAVLVLLADHGLAVSTIAARVAASARANLYAVVSAGLGAVDGPYHGAASTLAYRFLGEAMRDPIGALSEYLRAGGVPGFGHRVYQRRDPRAEVLFGLLGDAPVLETVEIVSRELAKRGGAFPNVDLALAAVLHTHGMAAEAGEAIFAIARIAGWTAHALEEYAEPRLRFRPLGVYTGPS